jgi:hypothetical protein
LIQVYFTHVIFKGYKYLKEDLMCTTTHMPRVA